MTTTPTEIHPMSLATAAALALGFGAELRAIYLERDREVAGLLLATVAECHVLLLGPPGTAKTGLSLTFAEGLGWTTFVRLLTRTSVPEELFGPFSLSALEDDRFERKLDGYLPTAQVAVLDEVFKANSSILNALLTQLNERTFDNGTQRIRTPLEVCVGASNEYPQDESLAALYDRFLLRFWVEYLRDDSSFEALLLADGGARPTLDPAAVEVLREAARRVDLRPIVPIVTEIRRTLSTTHGITASDRRWRQAMSLVRASAALSGRLVATARDLAVLADCLWDRREQSDTIRAVIVPHYSPHLRLAEQIATDSREIAGRVPDRLTMATIGTAGSAVSDLGKRLAEIRSLDQTDPDVATFTEEVRGLLASVETQIASVTRRSLS